MTQEQIDELAKNKVEIIMGYGDYKETWSPFDKKIFKEMIQTFKAGYAAAPAYKGDEKSLIDYIYNFAWEYGMYYHVGDFNKIMEQVKQRVQTPEEFLSSPTPYKGDQHGGALQKNIELRESESTPSLQEKEAVEWMTEKPPIKEDCIMLVLDWWTDHWETKVFDIVAADGENDEGEKSWYWSVSENGEEWGDLDDVSGKLFKIIPFPKSPII